MWLGEKRGHLSDWLTQLWVKLTGRRVALDQFPWLDGPSGATTGIGPDYYERVADALALEVREGPAGLTPSFHQLAGPEFEPARVDSRIVAFYENTSLYRIDTWSQWCGAFRPLGWLLAVLFSRRLQQLNIPLSPMDGSKGLRSRIVVLAERLTGRVQRIGWVRELRSTSRIAYVGDYSTVIAPGHSGPCVRVVFPLPNGNATVVLRPEAVSDGSLLLHSSGHRFGDPGFYFVVRDGQVAWVRYLATMRESLHVYVEGSELHTDHVFRIFGLKYLQLHYRMIREGSGELPGNSAGDGSSAATSTNALADLTVEQAVREYPP